MSDSRRVIFVDYTTFFQFSHESVLLLLLLLSATACSIKTASTKKKMDHFFQSPTNLRIPSSPKDCNTAAESVVFVLVSELKRKVAVIKKVHKAEKTSHAGASLSKTTIVRKIRTLFPAQPDPNEWIDDVLREMESNGTILNENRDIPNVQPAYCIVASVKDVVRGNAAVVPTQKKPAAVKQITKQAKLFKPNNKINKAARKLRRTMQMVRAKRSRR